MPTRDIRKKCARMWILIKKTGEVCYDSPVCLHSGFSVPKTHRDSGGGRIPGENACIRTLPAHTELRVQAPLLPLRPLPGIHVKLRNITNFYSNIYV